MDRMPSQNQIRDVVVEAYKDLLQHRIVVITETIRENLAEDAKGWVFECVAEVPYPNKENIPREVPLRVLIPEEFLHKPVDIYTMCAEVNGFPHQDAESGKLCLHEEDSVPRDASRLVCYIKWAIKWLEDAANGMLLKPGDPYELPDFRRILLDPPLPTTAPLIFEESPNSYESWKSYISTSGHVECSIVEGIQAIFVIKFHHKDGSLVRESKFSPNLQRKEGIIDGKWVLLPHICYEKHRPPQTYEEMNNFCSNNGVDFYQNLRGAWNLKNSCKFGILLIGFPIPRVVGHAPTEIHWQPLLFQNYDGVKKRSTKRRSQGTSSRQSQIWQKLIGSGCFSLSQHLPWGRVENVASERLYIRGGHSPKVQSTSIAFFGCGALGSSIAELLARGGVKQLDLFDPDLITFGNLCRHTLDGSSVGLNKAKALAERLSRANPLSIIQGHAFGIPLDSRSDEALHQVLTNADVFVDCTTSSRSKLSL